MTSNAEKAARAAASAPESWARIRLGDICEIVRGVSYKKDQASDQPEKGKVPILRATNIQDNALVLDSDLVYVPSDVVSDEQMLRVGDIVVATSSGSKHLVGKTAQVKESWRGSFGAFCAALRPKTEIDHRYLGYFFGSQEYKDYIRKKALGVNINNLRRGDLEEISVPVAPLDQQKRIVAEIEKQFSRLDEAVTNLKRVKANLKRYKAAILKAAVEGRLVETEASIARREGRSYETGEQLLQNILETRRSQWKGKGKYKEPAAPDTTDLPELPEGWVWSSVKAISTKVVDGVHKKPNYVPEGIPFVTVKNLTAGPGLSFAELSYVTQEDHIEFCKRTNPERGDILISKDGTLGVVRSINTDVAFSIFVSVALVKPVLKEMQRYLVITFESPVVQRQMVPKGSGLQHIHLEDLRADCIPLPPLPEQRRIVTEVERRFSLVSEVCAQIDVNLMRSGRLSQSILTSAFSARLLGEAMARSHHEALVLRSG